MACTKTLSSIAKDCNATMGGIKKVYVAPYNTSTYLVEDSSDGWPTIVKDLVEVSWEVFDFNKNTGSFTQTLQVGDGGNYVLSEVALSFKRMDASKRLAVQAAVLSDTQVIVKDCNNTFWALGIDEPVTVSAATGITGQNKTDQNGYTITFSDESLYFAPMLDTSAITKLPNGGK